MVTKGRLLAVVSLVFALAFCLLTSALAQGGGIYLDDIQVKNDGQVVFFDNFDDGIIRGWYQVDEASLVALDPKKQSHLLWMNKHGKKTAVMSRKLDLSYAGSVEFSAAVYVAPAAEQYEWQKEKVSAFSMAMEYREMPNKQADMIRIDVTLYPKDQSCKVAAKRNSPVVNEFKMTQKPVMPTGKWARLTLRLDPTTGTATTCLDDAPVASVPYDPAAFPRITSLFLSSSFGDGAEMSE